MEAPLGGTPPRPRVPRTIRTRPAPVPAGAVPGDPDRQLLSFRAPMAYYVDADRRCRGCGIRFVLTAREQKRWYESLGLALDARGARCPSCRRAWLREHGPGRALSDASRALSEAPLHVPAVLAYARAAVEHVERFGQGPIGAALAALAALREHAAAPPEALYREGRCHEAAGRAGRAAAAFRRFLAEPPAHRSAPLVRDARARLRRLERRPPSS